MASRLAGTGTGATASVRRHAGGGARAPRALRMLQRGPADPPRRSERNGVSIELPHQDVGLLSASRDIEIAVSGNAEHPRIKIQRFAVPQSAGRTAVKECCACERSSCRGPNCNVTGYQTVKWYTSSTSAGSRGPPNRRDGRARRLLFELSTGAGTAAARLKHWKRPYGSITSRMLYREKDPGRGRAFLLVRAGNMSRACPRVTQIWA